MTFVLSSHSDYGYNRTDVKKCKKLKSYDLAQDCPLGAKNVNKTLSGFRLIPGDRCKATDTSKHELKWELQPCTGNEEESGYDNEAESARRAVSHIHHLTPSQSPPSS